jgi:hypothetical protein
MTTSIELDRIVVHLNDRVMNAFGRKKSQPIRMKCMIYIE